MDTQERRARLTYLTTLAERVLGQIWQQQGLSVELRDGWLELAGEQLATQCTVVDFREHPGAHIAVVTLEVFAGPDERGVSISDTSVGLNPSLEGAVVNALRLWIEGVFPAIRVAWHLHAPGLANGSSKDVEHFELAVQSGPDWHVFAGPWQLSAPDRERFLESVLAQPPYALLRDALSAYVNSHGAPRFSWVKLFISRQANGEIMGECKLNGRDWPEGLQALGEFEWPEEEGYRAVKQFMVVRAGPI